MARAVRSRTLALTGVIALVVLAHAWITWGVSKHLSDMRGDDTLTIKRMEAELVADMELSEPPVVVAPPAAEPPPAAAAVAAEPAASAASAPEPEPAASAASSPEPAVATAEPAPSAPVAAEGPASEPTTLAQAAEPPASAPSAPAFEWPKATRVTFKMEGYLRGPIYGSAKVEWVREDLRYQVHVDAIAGPSFAPIASQRWTSEGTITPEGLQPARFESVNKLLIKSAAPKIVTFEDNEVVLPGGDRVARLPGVQDPASHYIQMAYMFMLHPGSLQVGRTLEMPLAWTKRQEIVTYDIDGTEILTTPLGQLETYRLKPRKFKNSKGDEVLAEIWIAPTLQYLPIRMLIRIGADTYFDMHMDRAPQQAPADAAAAASGASSPEK